jgi:tRNA A-37 threonylcarbamoyl transferase component Bud32
MRAFYPVKAEPGWPIRSVGSEEPLRSCVVCSLALLLLSLHAADAWSGGRGHARRGGSHWDTPDFRVPLRRLEATTREALRRAQEEAQRALEPAPPPPVEDWEAEPSPQWEAQPQADAAAEAESQPEPEPQAAPDAAEPVAPAPSPAPPAAPPPDARAQQTPNRVGRLAAALALVLAALGALSLAQRRRRSFAPTAPAPAPPPVRPVRDDATQPTRPRLRERAERVEEAVAAALRADAAGADAGPAAPAAASRYELLGEIGRGGMGVVYRARDKRLDRIVALKRLPENLRDHPRAVELLLREARSAARLNHLHIVTVYDVDQEDGGYFLTMEFLEGQPLNAILRRRKRFAPKEAVWLARQAATGLAYAHERQVVHRDVKTSNLFLTRSNAIKIMDFGLAGAIQEVRKRATLIGGTPAYMAPEQATGLAVDGRADLYALGVTLFELLTGGLPFEDGDLVHHHRHTPPPDPRSLAGDLPAALAELVLQMLAKEPDRRPASSAEVVARLRAL